MNYPKQGENLAAVVEVCFDYNTAETITGRIIRDDAEQPFRTIIVLNDGRVVMGEECQYRIIEAACPDDRSARIRAGMQARRKQGAKTEQEG